MVRRVHKKRGEWMAPPSWRVHIMHGLSGRGYADREGGVAIQYRLDLAILRRSVWAAREVRPDVVDQPCGDLSHAAHTVLGMLAKQGSDSPLRRDPATLGVALAALAHLRLCRRSLRLLP